MNNALLLIGRAGGAVGVVVAGFSIAARANGHFSVGTFQTSTLFLAGIAAMVFGCFCLLAVLTNRNH